MPFRTLLPTVARCNSVYPMTNQAEKTCAHGKVAGNRTGSQAKIAATDGWTTADFDSVVKDLGLWDEYCTYTVRLDGGTEHWDITVEERPDDY